MKCRSCISSTAWGARAIVALALVSVFALRPAGVEAILFHEHGENGRHFHIVSGAESGRVQAAHAVWHDHEHGSHDTASSNYFDSEPRSEDCDSIIIVFGKNLAIRAANSIRPVVDYVPADMDSANLIPLLALGASLTEPNQTPPQGAMIPRAERTISRLLLGNHALLI